jgi:hypothetical protein
MATTNNGKRLLSMYKNVDFSPMRISLLGACIVELYIISCAKEQT